MYKICYITDTHVGGDGTGWRQQLPYHQKLPQLFAALSDFLQRESADMLIIGGDFTDSGSPEQIEAATAMVNIFPVDFRLILGNHDLACPESFSLWKNRKDLMFQGDITSQWLDFAIDVNDFFIIGLQNAWGNDVSAMGHAWDLKVRCSGLLNGQLEWFEEIVSQNPQKRIFVFLHDTLFPLYPTQTGLDCCVHAPEGMAAQKLREIILKNDNIKLVMSGHCHATSLHVQKNITFVTTASFVEAPFQFRMLYICDNQVNVEVHDFSQLMGDCPLDKSKLWALGNEQSSNFKILLTNIAAMTAGN